VSSLHHVALEIKPDDLEACLAFYALVGFEEVALPDDRLVDEARFLQGGPTQIHLVFADAPVIPPRAHPALLLDDYEGTLTRLRGERMIDFVSQNEMVIVDPDLLAGLAGGLS